MASIPCFEAIIMGVPELDSQPITRPTGSTAKLTCEFRDMLSPPRYADAARRTLFTMKTMEHDARIEVLRIGWHMNHNLNVLDTDMLLLH
ncbi:hypothetical protein OPV22_009156 [Ensete ventricosum]|uniref:Uncharacterized protein n=1 Tax=Ensete ventricosum TaxID=4639 RepID=A0AAV8RA42_ENSVE|nr:hypothetical protein OPV22_009156 [Ensete ventricosum]